ncbi:MAG: hypothetical protein M3O41_08705 [Pseudomonadota bacterium]|nr:hypothetical protein [Pseudomonadota bacterium]
MNRTRFLVALLVVVVLLQLFPERAALIELVAIGAGALYCVAWAITAYLAHYKMKAALAAQEAADTEEFRQYEIELHAIREKHDPNRDLTDLASITQEYQDELTALHDKHQAMLTRKFGSR